MIFDVQDPVRILQMRSQEHKLLLTRVVHEAMDEPYRLEDHWGLVHCMVTDSIWDFHHETLVTYHSLIGCCFAPDVNDPMDS